MFLFTYYHRVIGPLALTGVLCVVGTLAGESMRSTDRSDGTVRSRREAEPVVPTERAVPKGSRKAAVKWPSSRRGAGLIRTNSSRNSKQKLRLVAELPESLRIGKVSTGRLTRSSSQPLTGPEYLLQGRQGASHTGQRQEVISANLQPVSNPTSELVPSKAIPAKWTDRDARGCLPRELNRQFDSLASASRKADWTRADWEINRSLMYSLPFRATPAKVSVATGAKLAMSELVSVPELPVSEVDRNVLVSSPPGRNVSLGGRPLRLPPIQSVGKAKVAARFSTPQVAATSPVARVSAARQIGSRRNEARTAQVTQRIPSALPRTSVATPLPEPVKEPQEARSLVTRKETRSVPEREPMLAQADTMLPVPQTSVPTWEPGSLHLTGTRQPDELFAHSPALAVDRPSTAWPCDVCGQRYCCCSGVQWSVRLDAMLLDRSAADGFADPLVNCNCAIPTVFNSESLGLDAEGAPRATVVRDNQCGGLDWEGTYYVLDEWSSVSFLEGPVFALGTDLGDGAAATGYQSKLQNAEINAFRDINNWNQLMFGARWLQLDESAFVIGNGTLVANFDERVDLSNSLIGGQVGWRKTLWDQGGFFTSDMTAKGGVFYNGMSRTMTLGTSPLEKDGLSFVGELDLNVNWEITTFWSLNAGYQMMWVTNVAEAPDQFFSQSAIFDDGVLFLHGLRLGVTKRF